MLGELTDEIVDSLAARALDLPAPETMIHIHQVGGAATRGADAQSADDDLLTSLRKSEFIVNVVGCCLNAADYSPLTDWVRDAASVFGPETQRRSYVNFSDAADPIRSATFSSDVREKWLALKRDLDPAGMFV